MACGTPVIAFENGSVPEILDHGKTGFIVENEEQAIKAVQHISLIERLECRRMFEERFNSTRMAEEYLQIYQNMIGLNGKRKNVKLVEI